MDTFDQDSSTRSLPLMFSNGLAIVQAYPCPSQIELSISIDHYEKFVLLTSSSVFIFNGTDSSFDFTHAGHFKRIDFFKLS